MAQVVSRSRKNDENVSGQIQAWKKPFLIIFHGVTASTYGFAICWQSVSAQSAILYARTNPLMRQFGKWRFLTYQCLVIQFVAYSMTFASHFVPRLRRQKDFFFTTFAFPIGAIVVLSFWSIWYTFGREFILPIALEPYYPPWLNHVTHTIIAPINLFELISARHQYASDKVSGLSLVAYIASYTSYLLFIRYQTGRFVYPFLNEMDAVPVAAFITGTAVFALVFYKSGRILHDIVHGIRSIRDTFTGKKVKNKN